MGNRKPLRINKVSRLTETIFHLVISLFSICCIIPFIFVIIISFSSKESIQRIGYAFIPLEWSTEAYEYAYRMMPQIGRCLFNSVYVTVVGTFLATAMCALYSYVLYRPDFRYRRFFAFLAFFTMIFSGGLVPTYLVSKNLLGLSENYAALIVPLLVNPFNIVVMRAFYKGSVPMELIEAARIDGSGEYATLFQIVLPIVKPGIATIALLNALAYWNDWFCSKMYIRLDKFLQPLQALLMQMQKNIDYISLMGSAMGTAGIHAAATAPNVSLRMVLVVFAVIPIACAYPFFQRYIISGLTIGSLKG